MDAGGWSKDVERRPGDADYVQLRVGLGGKPLSTSLVAPELDSGQHDPVTHMALQHLLAARSAVTELPVTIDLPECPVVVVEGDTSAARALVRAMVCQLAVFHGPSDVSIAAVVDGSSASEWDWLKWLPHHRSSLTTDAAGPARMTHRSMRQVTATTAKRVLVIVDAAPAREDGPVPAGMTVVIVGAAPGAMETLPRVRIDCTGDAFPERPDALTAMQAEVCARRLAPFHEGADDATTTPGTWAQLTGIPAPERPHRNCCGSRARSSDCYGSRSVSTTRVTPSSWTSRRPHMVAPDRTGSASGRRVRASRSSCAR